MKICRAICISLSLFCALAFPSSAYEISRDLDRDVAKLLSAVGKRDFDIAQSSPVEKCFYLLNQGKDTFKSGDFARSQAVIKQIKAYARPLGGEDRARLAGAMIRMSGQIARGNDNLVCRELLLNEARALAMVSSPSGMTVLFSSDMELAEIYQRAKDHARAVTFYTRALEEGPKVTPYPVDEMLNAHKALAKIYVDNKDTKYATICVDNAIKFVERAYGKKHLKLISLLVLRFKADSNEGAREKTVLRIKEIIDSYPGNSLALKDSKELSDMSQAVAALKSASHVRSRDMVNMSKSDKDNQETFAWFAYNLQTKKSGSFDSSGFRDLTKVLHEHGKLSQELKLYRDTISQLERSSDARNNSMAAGLRSRYSRLLQDAGDIQGAEAQDKRIEFDKAQKASEKKQEHLTKLANLESSHDSDVGSILSARMDVLKSRMLENDVVGSISELNKMQHTLSFSKFESSKMHGLNFKFNSLIRSNLIFVSQNPQLANKVLEVVPLLESKSTGPTGIERSGLRLSARQHPEAAEFIDRYNSLTDSGFKQRMKIEASSPVKASSSQTNSPLREETQARQRFVTLRSTMASGKILDARDQYLALLKDLKPQTFGTIYCRNDFVMATDWLIKFKQFDAAETGMRRTFENASLLNERDHDDFIAEDEKLTEKLVNGYMSAQDVERATRYLQYKISYISTQQVPNAGLLAKNQFLLSQIFILAARGDKAKAAQYLENSEKLYNEASAGLKSYYGEKSSQYTLAVASREKEMNRLKRE